MADNTKGSKLFKEFPPIPTEKWEELIIKDLKGADYDKKLIWKTNEGFNVRPYYRAEDLEDIKNAHTLPGDFPYVRGNKLSDNGWLVREDFNACNVEDANTLADHAIGNGVDSVGFITCSDCKFSADGIKTLLTDIDTEKIEINFVSGHNSPVILPLLVEVYKNSKVDTKKATGSFDFSPLAALSLNGKFCDNEKAVRERTGKFVESGRQLPGFRLMAVRGDIFRSAGSSLVHELAFSLAMGAEYMTWLTEQGIPADEAASKLKFTFAVGSSYFLEIAKFRAARMLWAKIVEAYEPKDLDCAKMCIHAVSSTWNKTIYDPYVNMLRTTTEAMAAALGGVHSMTVLPFDATYQPPTVLSARVARNQQLILKEEAYFDKVIDPAAGSYYIESIVKSMAEHAWEQFLKVQEMGGYTEAFKKGYIQTQNKEVAQKRESNIATRRETVLGTNQYPNFNEVADPKVVYRESVEKPGFAKPADAPYEPLVAFRGSQSFEELRYKTDTSGKRPKAFMLTLGKLAFRRARAQFSCNFFATAGFEVIDNIGFNSINEGLKVALGAKADIVVLCSSDEEYETLAPEVNEKLGNRAILVIAGEPACKPDLETKGIKNYISLKSNVLDTLKYYQQLLKI
ncbi:MAG: methylmalonyl-CoA mutase family protein [Tenuifilaceae bacterium]|jgi:methylmalonyl-CoA mutase|nr:methylmalonyl-CoA mutase family protein [Bacteroidales bacterium]MDI9517549.1 methylmalonyl-CoA mutase family protein [Bacteroidota bacterium]NLH55644.1 methylmalonyl-CoA mutase small subunit [Rikenellaceae bacterium]OQC64489.1 MAG: Methylmalonyl-CoA mutase small subunit [Bacteroidetes bacterium ADurb.Bin008]HNV80882.1 methylmalonyl-CoA mutase family protein [Tenuifilaceae bacterium]